MGWLVFAGALVLLGVLIWRREHRGSKCGFAIRGERGVDAAHQANMELRNITARNMSGGSPGGGAPGF